MLQEGVVIERQAAIKQLHNKGTIGSSLTEQLTFSDLVHTRGGAWC